MSRRRPRLNECKTMDDFVRGGFAQVVVPATETGARHYGIGRYCVSLPPVAVQLPQLPVNGAILDLRADLADSGTGPGSNSPATETWTDVSGEDNHGTLTNIAYTSAEGWNDSPPRLTLDGSGYVALPDLSVAEDKTFTYEVWANLTAGATQYMIGEGLTASGTPFVVLGAVDTGHAYCAVRDDAFGLASRTGPTVRSGAIHQFLLVSDGTNLQMYVDAAAEGAAVALPGGSITLDRAAVGCRPRGAAAENPAVGSIYVARIYPFALDPDDVAQNFAAGYETAVTSIGYTDLVTVTSDGATAAGEGVAYARNSSGNYYGPVLVTPTAKSEDQQTAIAALWSDPVGLFKSDLVAVGDALISLAADSRAYVKV